MKNRYQRIIKALVIYNITVLLFLVSCNPIKQSSENTNQVSSDGVILRISTNKTAYKPGETIVVDASIENISENTIEYEKGEQDFVPAVYLVDNPYLEGFGLWEKRFHGGPTINPLTGTGELKPHEIKSREVVWDQKFQQNIQAPQDEYSIACSFKIIRNHDPNLYKTLSINIYVHITGGKKWITPDQAENIAVNLPEVKDWQKNHTGNNIAKEENGNYYVYMANEWQKVSPEFFMVVNYKTLTLEELQQSTPEVYVYLVDGQWEVDTYTDLGEKPHNVQVLIDPETGSIIKIEFSN